MEESTYESFLAWVASQPTEEGIVYHNHHIIPRSEGGDNNKENLVKLTPQQHAWAHYLYDKENNTNTCKVFKDRLRLPYEGECSYEDFAPLNEMEAIRWERQRSEETKQKISSSHIGKTHSDETRQKMSESAKRRWKNRKLQPCL